MTLSQIARELKEIKALLDINDLISEEDAAKLMGMKLGSFRRRVYEKKVEGCYIINVLGRRNFYKSKLLNFDL